MLVFTKISNNKKDRSSYFFSDVSHMLEKLPLLKKKLHYLLILGKINFLESPNFKKQIQPKYVCVRRNNGLLFDKNELKLF